MQSKESKKELLRSCPFCGGEAELQSGWCELDNYVVCLTCKSSTRFFNAEKFAIEAWNRRDGDC